MTFSTFLIGPCMVLASLFNWAFMAGTNGDRIVVGVGYLLVLAAMIVFAFVAGRRRRLDGDTIIMNIVYGSAIASVALWILTTLLTPTGWLLLGTLVTLAMLGTVRRESWPLFKRFGRT